MNLDLINDVLNSVRENKVVQNFIDELASYLENTMKNNKENKQTVDSQWNDLLAEDLTLYGTKIINKYRDEMLVERKNIVKENLLNNIENGEKYYVYEKNSRDENVYNAYNGSTDENISINKNELPEGTELGYVIIKNGENKVIDRDTTNKISSEINKMIKQKISEQNEYLEKNRIEGHTYEVGEKYDGRVWLYDLDNSAIGMEGIEEISIPTNIYENLLEGDKLKFENGEFKVI